MRTLFSTIAACLVASLAAPASAQDGTDMAARVKAGQGWGTTAVTTGEIAACWATVTALGEHIAASGRGTFPVDYTPAALGRRAAEWDKAMRVAFARNPDDLKPQADAAHATARSDIAGSRLAARAETAGNCVTLPGMKPPPATSRIAAVAPARTAPAVAARAAIAQPVAPKATVAAASSGWSVASERKCAAGDPVACWQTGEAHELGRGTAKDPVKAVAAFTAACTGGIAEACFVAARTRSNGAPGVVADPAAATALYTQGCEAGSGDACTAVAVRTETGRGATKDAGLAMAFFERACQLKEGRSCLYLAQLWASGENAAKRVDGTLALKYAAGGCNAGSGEACGLASYLVGGKLGAPADADAAERYASFGCEFNHFGGCMQLGYAANQRKQHTDALRWYRKACALGGQQNSCQAVRTIETYLADVAAGGAERRRWDEAQAAGGAVVAQLLGAGDYAGAMHKAAYGMGSVDQVSRVLLAASRAGRIADVPDVYFVTFQTWQLSSPARMIFDAEARARTQRQRQENQARMVAASARTSAMSWARSTSTIRPTTYAAIPAISESAIYKSARESVSRSYCSAGWGCR